MTQPYSGEERRAYESNGALAGIPAWARVVAVIGIPGAIALFLVWAQTNTLPKMNNSIILLQVEQQTLHKTYMEHVAQGESLYRLMQRICSNTAKSEVERQQCFNR